MGYARTFKPYDLLTGVKYAQERESLKGSKKIEKETGCFGKVRKKVEDT